MKKFLSLSLLALTSFAYSINIADQNSQALQEDFSQATAHNNPQDVISFQDLINFIIEGYESYATKLRNGTISNEELNMLHEEFEQWNECAKNPTDCQELMSILKGTIARMPQTATTEKISLFVYEMEQKNLAALDKIHSESAPENKNGQESEFKSSADTTILANDSQASEENN